MTTKTFTSNLPAQSDEQLVSAYKRGEVSVVDVLRLLEMRHKSSIYQHAFRMLKNHEEAQDISQEVLIRISRFLDRFDERSKFATWLYRITANQCLTRLKANANTKSVSDECLIEEAGHEPAYNTQHEAIEEVRRALKGLSHSDRNVLELRFYSELSMEDLATTMGISLSASKMRFYRALERFKEGYEAELSTQHMGVTL